MSWLDRLRGRKAAPDASASPGPVPQCPHVTLVPHWDKPEDMGHEDRASSFRCDGCSSTFTPDETRELRRTEGERLTGQSSL